MRSAPMTPSELAVEIGIEPKALRAWLRRRWPRFEPGARWEPTEEQVAAARGHFAGRYSWPDDAGVQARSEPLNAKRQVAHSAPEPRTSRRDESDEAYVLDLVDEILEETGSRQHRFEWLLGDPDPHGVARRLPVDGYWPQAGIVLEYREIQHDEPVPHFDNRPTVSGVDRGEQRRVYDVRRDEEVPKHGLRLVVVRPSDLDANGRGRLRRNREADRAVLNALITRPGID